jgi:predicted nucleic acid-binding protein
VAILLWDASALLKRFVVETGSATVDALCDASATEHLCTTLTYVEVAAAIRRRFNQNRLDADQFRDARQFLRTAVFAAANFELRSLTNADIFGAIDLVDRHNLNSADGAILHAYLAHALLAQAAGNSSLLIASHRRLLRAALLEGLRVLDPETVGEADVPVILAAL